MKKVLLIGAGRSTYSLINYLKNNSLKYNWDITIADRDISIAKERFQGIEQISIVEFDVNNEKQRKDLILGVDIVISMLPAHMHVDVAKDCIAFKKNMVTASYISNEMKQLEDDAKASGVTIMNEIGVDPGIDHLSAMKVIDNISQCMTKQN